MKNWILIMGILMGDLVMAGNVPFIHPYHVGSVEIKFNGQSQTFQVTAKFFLDDLENAINLKRKNGLFFYQTAQKLAMQKALRQYMKAHLVIKSEDKNIRLNFLGFEEVQESVYIYLESDKTSSPSQVTVGLNALYDLFEDQMNIVHLSVNGERRSHKLNFPDIYFIEKF
ncbi:hypothetical protein GO491_01725 [Flavobacteriaceae bacterium Ap0902]|nr:hypothetical protein [Flavobacteriaceae bacterium Ap0902]